MSNPTYAQNNEDIRLWCALYDCPYKNYVDIGAGHPSELSVTKIFYDNGWRGVNVEPGPNFDLLMAERPEDLNINAAIFTLTCRPWAGKRATRCSLKRSAWIR